MVDMSTTHLPTAQDIETCGTCGQDFDTESAEHEPYAEVTEVKVGDDETEERWTCGHCAPRPTGHIEWKDGVPWWVEDGEWAPFKLH